MIERFIKSVCFCYGISPDDVTSIPIKKNAVDARLTIIYLLHKRGVSKLMVRSHLKLSASGYCNLINKSSDRVAVDSKFKQKVLEVKAKC